MQASSVNCGIICHQSAAGTPVEKEMMKFTSNLTKQYGKEINYEQCGSLTVCLTSEEAIKAQNDVEIEKGESVSEMRHSNCANCGYNGYVNYNIYV